MSKISSVDDDQMRPLPDLERADQILHAQLIGGVDRMCLEGLFESYYFAQWWHEHHLMFAGGRREKAFVACTKSV